MRFFCHLPTTTKKLENADGWPDKICIQCVHQVSRCHAFKKRVESSNKELHRYIKGITVIVEEPQVQTVQLKTEQEIHLTSDLLTTNHHHHHHHHHPHHPHHHQVQAVTIQQPNHTTGQQIVTTTHQPQQMIITNGQLHNAQIINAAGQIVGTTPLQSALTTAQIQPTIQLVQTSKKALMRI